MKGWKANQWNSIVEFVQWLRDEASDADVIAHTKRSVQQHPVWRAQAEGELARRRDRKGRPQRLLTWIAAIAGTIAAIAAVAGVALQVLKGE